MWAQAGIDQKPAGLGRADAARQGTEILAILASRRVRLGGQEAHARDFRAADNQVEDYPTVQALMAMDQIVNERTRRPPSHPGVPFAPAGRGNGDDPADARRRDRSQPDQYRADRQLRAGSQRAGPAVPVPIDGALLPGLDGPIGTDILATFEAHGFVGLAFYDSGARSFYNNVRPVRTLADLKGMRIRVQQSDLMIDMIKALGAVPVALPYGQVLTGLTTRLIDGAENNWPSYVTTNHYTAAPPLQPHRAHDQPGGSGDVAQGLGRPEPEDRTIFREAAQESSRFMRRQWNAWEERSRSRRQSRRRSSSPRSTANLLWTRWRGSTISCRPTAESRRSSSGSAKCSECPLVVALEQRPTIDRRARGASAAQRLRHRSA